MLLAQGKNHISNSLERCKKAISDEENADRRPKVGGLYSWVLSRFEQTLIKAAGL